MHGFRAFRLAVHCLAMLAISGSTGSPVRAAGSKSGISAQAIEAYADFTLVLWVKTGGSKAGEVFRRHDGRGGGRGIAVQLADHGPIVTLVGPRGQVILRPNEAELLAPDSWHFLALTVDHRLDDGAQLWLDGRLIARSEGPPEPVASSRWLAVPDPAVPPSSDIELQVDLELGRAASPSELMLRYFSGAPPVVPPPGPVAVDSSHRAQASLEVRTWPAPVREELHFEYRPTRPGRVVATICDLQGRRRYQRDLGWRSLGRGELRLGPDVLGQLTPGCYYLRLESGALTAAKRLIVVP